MRGSAALFLMAMGTVMLAGCAGDPPEPSEPLAVGDCLIVSGVGGSGDAVPTVACDQPHEAEVYAVVEVAAADPYDEAEVIASVEQECVERFDAYTGEAYATSSLDIFYTWPLAESWDAGDRGAVCAAFVPDESGVAVMFEGTLAGT